MYKKKLLILSMGLGLAILSWGKATWAQDNKSTLTTGISATNKAATPVSGLRADVIIRRATSFQGETNSGVNISIPQDVFQTIIGTRTITPMEINSNNLGNINSTGDNFSPGSNSVNGDIPSGTHSPVVICLTEPCMPDDSNSINSISINKLAKLIESDLNQALNDLVAAQQAASDGIVAADNSHQIVRRESDAQANCGCIPGETKVVRELANSDNFSAHQNVMSVTEARQIVETKLEESSIFVEQVNQLKPENSLW